MIKIIKFTVLMAAFCFTQIAFGQQEAIYKLDNVLMRHSIVQGEQEYRLTIEITNNNEFEIYIPKLVDNGLYFFQLSNKLYLHYGLSFSILGEQNPSAKVSLITISSKGIYRKEITIPKKGKVDIISVGLEYIKKLNRKATKTNLVDYEYYTNKKTTLYTEYGNVSN